ncbi:hypothetical protein BDN71DRAFT_1503407 [Pleurotus eryngii]|uniref:C2H2-type domain-containing protein n=1 Tax=Pleurotus eryngii TaxID=5323 RepID=A0A9P6A4R6_PLEER|nr:hypothetical protein BDN71DRAFT_1503407 [Pleurotus eryngii]
MRWGQMAVDGSVIAQNLASAAVPRSEQGQHDAHTLASLTFELAFEEHVMFEGWDHKARRRVIWRPAKAEQSVGVHVPAVIRPTISTPAIIASAERRRKYPRKHASDICGNMSTSKANRDRHIRAHYGIKPSVCRCGMAFTAKSDLERHRKGSRCPFLGRAEA